jgi:glycosyltransferase involved in cell wall biosynthesis
MAKYLRHFKAHRYDVVHVHYSPDFLLPAVAARITRQPCTIMTRHVVLPWSSTKVRLYTSLFDHFIPVSNAVERQLEVSGVPKTKMTVAKAGCPPLMPSRLRDDTRRELGIEDDLFAIGFFGRLVAEKGVDTLITASPATEHRVSFEVFGEGPLSVPLEERAQESGSRVRFHGFRDDVPECLLAIDAVVIPSVWEEAFPYAALEAMSVGRTVLASRVGGMPEIIEEGSTGYLFNKRDASGLATMASKLASDPAGNVQMGQRAMELHRSTYTIQKMAERIEAVYRAQAGRR